MYTNIITVDGIDYRMIDEARIRREILLGHSMPTEYGSCLAVRADEMPDEAGAVDLYEFKYVLIDPEDFENGPEWYNNIDWEAPDDIVKCNYKWRGGANNDL